MVLNQLLTVPNRAARRRSGRRPTSSVNGRLRPVVQMQPGEVQLWRIANTAGRSRGLFPGAGRAAMAADRAGRRAVRQPELPREPEPADLCGAGQPHRPAGAGADATDDDQRAGAERHGARRRQADTGQSEPERSQSRHTAAVGRGVRPAGDAERPGDADAVHQPRRRSSRRSWRTSPTRSCVGTTTPARRWTSIPRRLAARCSTRSTAFSSRTICPSSACSSASPRNGRSRTPPSANGAGPDRSSVPHPHQSVPDHRGVRSERKPDDPTTGQLIGVLNSQNKTVPVPQIRPRAGDQRPIHASACSIRTIRAPGGHVPIATADTNLVWWDVFAIPSGLAAPTATNPNNVIPGYFRMRSRFVDYRRPLCAALSHPDPRGSWHDVQRECRQADRDAAAASLAVHDFSSNRMPLGACMRGHGVRKLASRFSRIAYAKGMCAFEVRL